MSDASQAAATPRVRLIESPVFTDGRGSLTPIDLASLPFAPVRMFTVYGVPGPQVRGVHAHRACEQILTCMHGSVVVTFDDGVARGEVTLDRPSQSLYMPALVWGSQRSFSPDAVLMVLASLPYDVDDYIDEYDEFRAALGARR